MISIGIDGYGAHRSINNVLLSPSKLTKERTINVYDEAMNKQNQGIQKSKELKRAPTSRSREGKPAGAG